MRNKVVGVSVIASIVGTAACAPRSGSAGSSLAYVGAGLAAVGGTIALVMAESGPSGGGSDFSGIGALPGLLFLGGAGTISTASGLIALLSPSSTSSGVPRESGPPIATTDERVARWADVARRMAASRQCGSTPCRASRGAPTPTRPRGSTREGVASFSAPDHLGDRD